MFALTTAATAALATAGYQSLAPTGQWFGQAFCRGRRGSKQIALTFDDGPNDPHTFNLLDVLARHNAQATFFLIGRYVHQRPDIAAEIARRGHVIGNHTFTHPLLTFQSTASIHSEISQCRDAIHNAVGEHSNLFRPPWGGRRPAVFRVARQLGLKPVMWNTTGYDWKAPSPDFIVQKVGPKIHGGDVILLHDGGHASFGTDRSATVTSVNRLLTRFLAEGYEFVTIPQMMAHDASSADEGVRRFTIT
jgi:peptidoglycan/xylan/chitin deacetylase (PgdA/CDA1 family)